MTAGISRARPDERGSERDSDDAAGTESCIEIARAALAHPERADRKHDIEDIEHADRYVLRSEQPDEEARLRLVAEHVEALHQLGYGAGRSRRRLAARALGSAGRGTALTRTSAPISRKTQPGPQAAITSPATAGATRTLTLSIHPETTLAAVSSSGTLASAGTSVGNRRSRNDDRRRRDGGPGIREPRWPAENQYGCSRAHRDALGHVAQGENEGGAIPIGENRGERREERCRNELDECDESGHRCAASVVRVHDHRDPDGPLGAVEEEQGDLLPPEVGVAEDDSDGVADLV